MYTHDGKGIKTIANELGISKNTVRKYVREYENTKQALNENKEENNKDELVKLLTQKPTYDTSNRQGKVVTEEVIEKIQYYLDQNDRYRALGIKKQCMTSQDIYEQLLECNIQISYCTVNNTVKKLIQKSKEAFIKQHYEYGDVCEFDWGEVKLEIHSKIFVFKIAVFTAAKSNYRFAYLYPKEATEFFLDSHVRFFNDIRGVYKVVVYDNMKVAVKRFVGRNEKEATEALKSISLYYGFKYRFCNCRKGNEKGHVERSVSVVRNKAFSSNIKFNSLEEANVHLLDVLKNLNDKNLSDKDSETPNQILMKEKQYLLPIVVSPYDTAQTKELRVDKYSTIAVETNRYSVPDYLTDNFVTVKIYTDNIKIYESNNLIATHKRRFSKHNYYIDIMHFRKTLLKKPGAIRGSLAFEQLQPKLQKLYDEYFSNAPKDFIELLNMIETFSLEGIFDMIDKLKSSHSSINLSAIRLLLERKNHSSDYNIKTKDTKDEIEEKSLENISKYDTMFNTGKITNEGYEIL